MVKKPITPLPEPTLDPTGNPVVQATPNQEIKVWGDGIGITQSNKPFISPTLQSRIDAKNAPVTPVAPTPAPVIPEPVVTPVVEPVKPVETVQPIVPLETKVEPVKTEPVAPIKPVEITDAEKNAQSTGVKYTMVDGIPQYSPTNKEEALKVLQMWGKLQWESAMSAVAKMALDKYRNLAQMTDTQLAQNITNGSVSSRELEQINAINPDLVTKAKDLARKSTITDTANAIQAENNAIVTGQEVQVQNKALTTLLNKVAELDANAESYADIKARVYENYPDMENSRKEIVTAQTQLRELQRAKRELFDDYKAKNSGLPISMIMAGYSTLSRGLDDQIYEVNDTLNQNIALYNSYLDEANAEIDWEIGNQAKQEQRLFDLYGVTNAAEIRQEDFARADKLLADEIARADQKDAQTLQRLEQERIDNVKVAIAQLWVTPTGETYDDLLGQYANAVRNQPRDLKPFTVGKDSMVFDPSTGKYIVPPWATGTAPAPSRKPTISSEFTPEWTFKVNIAEWATPRKSSRGFYECGMLVNDTLGIAMADLHEDKLEYVNSNQPVVGGAFIEKTNDKYGHTGIVESINPDWTLNIVETNYPLGSGVSRKTIDPNDRNIVWYYDPQAASQSGYMDITDITLPEKTTEYKSKSFWFWTRMDNSDKILQNVDKRFMESSDVWEYITPRWAFIPNFLKSTEQQQYEQAQRDFINSKLRQESGAVISDQEFDNARKQYFPQPWDSDEVIKQKSKNRQLVIEEMFRAAWRTEKWEDIFQIYKSIRWQRENTSNQETYTSEEEALIKELAQKWATDEEIDQAINLFRKK